MSLGDRLRQPLVKATLLEKNRGGHGMFLRQPPTLSRAILWTLMITTLFLLLWAFLAKMDEVVTVKGKLEPVTSVAEVQSAVPGVIAAINVKDGDLVKKGQVLLVLDKVAQTAYRESLSQELAGLKQEYEFYQKVMAAPLEAAKSAREAGASEEIVSLAKDRASLLADNRLLEAQMKHSTEGEDLASSQLQLFKIAELDRSEKISQASLAAQSAEREQLAIKGQLEAAQKLAANAKIITETYEKLTDRGGVAQIEYLSRQADLIRNDSQVGVFRDKIASLQLEIQRAREEERNVETAYIKDVMARRSDNLKSLAETDARLGKITIETKRRIGETEAKLASAEVDLDQHTVTAPVDGIVQDCRFKKPGPVLQASELLMRIVPVGEKLVASVHIPNERIGFVRSGMNCEVRIDTFPFREFGEIKGHLTLVGSDAVLNEDSKSWLYPAKVDLDRESLSVHGQTTALQSGMAVTVNIHIRKRSVMSIFVDFLMKPVEGLRQVR